MDSTIDAHSPIVIQHSSPPQLLSIDDRENSPAVSDTQRAVTAVSHNAATELQSSSTHSDNMDHPHAEVEDIAHSEQPHSQQEQQDQNLSAEAAVIQSGQEEIGLSRSLPPVQVPPEIDRASALPGDILPDDVTDLFITATQLYATRNTTESTSVTEDRPNPQSESQPDIPEWTLWEDDLSTPTEEELEALKGADTETDASDVALQEKVVFPNHDDPDQRPVKKIRLNWTIRGVRGTKERPNRARVIHSPAILIDGLYWQIKFFPRGNKCSSLSGYIQASRTKPTPDKESVESLFVHYESSAEGNIGKDAEIKSFVKTEATPNIGIQSSPARVNAELQDTPEASKESKKNVESEEEVGNVPTDEEDFRVSAQLGMVIYNPQEPRTGFCQSSEHLFCPTNNDWGWSQLVTGKWEEIHKRKPGQRQALLRDDTIVIDAYIRIFDDPSQSLFWHVSHEEPQWPSKILAGCFPMGTPPLYHSPAVAGITAWLFLKPFREVLQSIDCGGWRTSSRVRPRPFIARLQCILHQMRCLKNTTYVNLHSAIEALREYGETHTDVVTFWETFRRAVELELDGEDEMLQRIALIFDVAGTRQALPPLPVRLVGDIQTALSKVTPLENQSWSQGPEFLPLMLEREEFDDTTREWRLRHDKVTLNEEISLPFSDNQRYSLYGFVVHVGSRNSGHFYSIIRPHGPGTKWLAFEDGDGNKIFSYTRKMLESYEGLIGDELKNFSSTRETAYLAMYIRKDRLMDYLPGSLEEYSVPTWLENEAAALDSHEQRRPRKKDVCKDESVLIEAYHDQSTVGQRGLLDMFNVKHANGGFFQTLLLPATTTFQDVRRKIAEDMGIGDAKTLKLFGLAYGDLGQYDNARWYPARLQKTLGSWKGGSKPLCIWISVLQTQSDIDLFADPDVPLSEGRGNRKSFEVPENDSNATANDSPSQPTVNDTESSPHTETQATRESDRVQTADLEQSVHASLLETPASLQDMSDPTQGVVQSEASPSGALVDDGSDEMSLAVTHGHLMDVMVDIERIVAGAVEAQNAAAQQHATSGEDEAAIAALIAADAAEISASSSEDSSSTAESPAVLDEHHREEDMSSRSSVSDVVLQPQKRKPTVYGFLQKFDVREQTFIVHGTFFGFRCELVREVVRKRMGFAEGTTFNVWVRTTAIDGILVKDSDDFQDVNFVDGVDIIIGEALGEEQIMSLRAAGQFWEPFELSRFLRLQQRRHPHATTVDHVSICDFGQDRYKGPLVNGRRHGASCTLNYSNGQLYRGPLVCNRRHGSNGQMTYQNGDGYFGEWKDDEQHGRGSFVQKRTGNKYEGSFQNGRRWGQGTTWWQVADEEANLCQICYGEEIDALFFDCGHVCSCMECAKQCDVCPICRRSIKEVVKMYRV